MLRGAAVEAEEDEDAAEVDDKDEDGREDGDEDDDDAEVATEEDDGWPCDDSRQTGHMAPPVRPSSFIHSTSDGCRSRLECDAPRGQFVATVRTPGMGRRLSSMRASTLAPYQLARLAASRAGAGALA